MAPHDQRREKKQEPANPAPGHPGNRLDRWVTGFVPVFVNYRFFRFNRIGPQPNPRFFRFDRTSPQPNPRFFQLERSSQFGFNNLDFYAFTTCSTMIPSLHLNLSYFYAFNTCLTNMRKVYVFLIVVSQFIAFKHYSPNFIYIP